MRCTHQTKSNRRCKLHCVVGENRCHVHGDGVGDREFARQLSKLAFIIQNAASVENQIIHIHQAFDLLMSKRGRTFCLANPNFYNTITAKYVEFSSHKLFNREKYASIFGYDVSSSAWVRHIRSTAKSNPALHGSQLIAEASRTYSTYSKHTTHLKTRCTHQTNFNRRCKLNCLDNKDHCVVHGKIKKRVADTFRQIHEYIRFAANTSKVEGKLPHIHKIFDILITNRGKAACLANPGFYAAVKDKYREFSKHNLFDRDKYTDVLTYC